MHLLGQNHLGWLLQPQQIAHQKIVQIDLLPLGTALEPLGTNFLWGIKTWLSRQCWTNWHLECMGWSMYQSNHGVLSVYHFLEGVQCNMYSTYNNKCLLSTTHPSVQGNTLNETSQVDSWVGKGVGQRIFGPVATPLPMKNSLKVIPVEVQRCVKQHCPEKWVTDSHAKCLKQNSVSVSPQCTWNENIMYRYNHTDSNELKSDFKKLFYCRLLFLTNSTI